MNYIVFSSIKSSAKWIFSSLMKLCHVRVTQTSLLLEESTKKGFSPSRRRHIFVCFHVPNISITNTFVFNFYCVHLVRTEDHQITLCVFFSRRTVGRVESLVILFYLAQTWTLTWSKFFHFAVTERRKLFQKIDFILDSGKLCYFVI